MISQNTKMIEIIAEGLGNKLEDAVFVGGSVLEYYVDDPAVSKSRPTDDVDISVEVLTRAAYDKFEEELREKGFVNDITGPSCRMLYKDVKVDIISVREITVGFTNRWYEDGYNNSIKAAAGEYAIRIFPVEYFIASKISAFRNRGKNNLITSEDFEDIIYIFDGRNNIESELKACKKNVKEFIVNEFKILLSNPLFNEAVAAHLGHNYSERSDRTTDIFKNLVK